MQEEQPQEWKWTETPDFAADCAALSDDPGEVDFLRGVIADSMLSNPWEGSNGFLDAAFPDIPEINSNVRYFRTFEAPGLTHLPPKVVIFQIEPEPPPGQPRELTGLALWDDEEA